MKTNRWLYAVAAGSGILVWVLVSMLSGRREAWDSEAYYQIGLPALCVVSAVLGYFEPERPWRWGAIPLAAQAATMVGMQGLGNLWPLGLIVSGVLAVPPIMTSKFGAFLRMRKNMSGSPSG